MFYFFLSMDGYNFLEIFVFLWRKPRSRRLFQSSRRLFQSSRRLFQSSRRLFQSSHRLFQSSHRLFQRLLYQERCTAFCLKEAGEV
jgi:hypothetical protein